MDLRLNETAVQSFMFLAGIDSVAELARRSKIDRTYLSRMLRGQRPVQPSHVHSLAGVLRTSPISLLGPPDTEAAEAALVNA